MPSFKTLADISTRLSVFDSRKGSSNTFKTHKNISLFCKRRYLILYGNFYVLDVLFGIPADTFTSPIKSEKS